MGARLFGRRVPSTVVRDHYFFIHTLTRMQLNWREMVFHTFASDFTLERQKQR